MPLHTSSLVVFLNVVSLLLLPALASSADQRPAGYQPATGEVADFVCKRKDGSEYSMEELAIAKVQIQAESYIAVNKDYKGCVFDPNFLVLANRNLDYVDEQGGTSRFFMFEGRVTCKAWFGLAEREMRIPRLVQHYTHPKTPSGNKCI